MVTIIFLLITVSLHYPISCDFLSPRLKMYTLNNDCDRYKSKISEHKLTQLRGGEINDDNNYYDEEDDGQYDYFSPYKDDTYDSLYNFTDAPDVRHSLKCGYKYPKMYEPCMYTGSRSSKNIAQSAANLAIKSLEISTKATFSTLKTTGRVLYYLTTPKYVGDYEVYGLWRLDQIIQIPFPNSPMVTCAANINFTAKGDAVTKYMGIEHRTRYHYKARSWPRSSIIEFEARAFEGPNDPTPISYIYKGSFRRKLADSSVLRLAGKIYEIRKGRFGGGKRRGDLIGKFYGRRKSGIMFRNNRKSYGEHGKADIVIDDEYTNSAENERIENNYDIERQDNENYSDFISEEFEKYDEETL